MTKLGGIIMIKKKIGIIGCGNMGGAILYGALESGVLDKENVYDINPAMMEKGIHPGELKDMVTSPGGTTIEGCEALEKAGMRSAVIECINVSTEKSRSL